MAELEVQTCKAVVCPATGDPRAEVQTVPLPQLKDDLILVKVKAVALNQTDWKSIDMGQAGGARCGCDYAGVVEAVGAGVSKDFQKGDRVCGMIFGANKDTPDMGAFGEYAVAKGDLQIKIPDNLSFEEAATLGVGISTVGQGLYQTLQLPPPATPLPTPRPILIYGGSTATGILAIQFAKASGLTVLTTCSPHNFDYVRSLGADHVYDYHTADLDGLAREIKALTANQLTLAFDCSPTEASARFCALAMSNNNDDDDDDDNNNNNNGSSSSLPAPCQYCSILLIPAEVVTRANPRVVAPRAILAYSMFGRAFSRYGLEFPDRPADWAFGVRWWESCREVLASGRVRAARREMNRGGAGLEGVVVGLREMKEGKYSGTKLVYTI